MKLRKGSSGGRGSLECLSFSPSWLCRFGLFALERGSVSIFHSSWGNLLKELFCEITLCRRALCIRGHEGRSRTDSSTSGGSETGSQEWMVTAWPVELFCYQGPLVHFKCFDGVLPGAQVLESAQAEAWPAAYLSHSYYSGKGRCLSAFSKLYLVPFAALHWADKDVGVV